MELICSRRVHVEKGLVKTITTSCRVHTLRDGMTCALSLGERVEISVSQSFGRQKGLEEQTSSLWALERDSWHSPASSKWQISLQTAVLRQFHYGTFQTLQSGFKGTCCTWICVGVYLFLYCTFKHEYVSVYCKTERGDRQRRTLTSEIYHPLIETFLKTDTSAHIMYLSSPSCCYPYSHVQIKLQSRPDNWKP